MEVRHPVAAFVGSASGHGSAAEPTQIEAARRPAARIGAVERGLRCSRRACRHADGSPCTTVCHIIYLWWSAAGWSVGRLLVWVRTYAFACLQVRQSAGLLLKNNLRRQYLGLSEAMRGFIRAALVQMVGHALKPLRHTAGTCIVTVVVTAGMATWPQLVPTLAERLGSSDAHQVDGALDTLYKVGWAGWWSSLASMCPPGCGVAVGCGQASWLAG